MSNYKMVDVEKPISTQHEQFTRFKTAYDYLNKITFTINRLNIDLLVGDIVSIISRVTNLILTRNAFLLYFQEGMGDYAKETRIQTCSSLMWVTAQMYINS